MAKQLNPIDVHVGELLAALRSEKHFSVAQMAAALGVGTAALTAIEAGVQCAPSQVLSRVFAIFEDRPAALPH